MFVPWVVIMYIPLLPRSVINQLLCIWSQISEMEDFDKISEIIIASNILDVN
jgi:hypothetical protein